MRMPNADIDVSELPTTVFDARSPTWWGMLGFVVVETMMFAVGIVSYFYLRRNFDAYPPWGTANPELLWPTIGLLLLLASIGAARVTDRNARRFDARGMKRGLALQVAFGVAILAVRAYEFLAVNTRWDTDAYGSTIWMLLGFHTLHLLIDTIESGVMWLIVHRGKVENKHFPDSSDGAQYWYYVALVWIPLYVVIYLTPRWM
jgi:cytochrome c oxidase subunit III